MSDDDKPNMVGKIKEKLIASKEKWAREGRLLTGKSGAGRLPPGQRLVREWPVLDLGEKPNLDLRDWKLTIDGLVAAPQVWDWAMFQKQPQIESVSDMHCVTAWSRYDNHWSGISAQQLIALVKPKPEAKFVMFTSYDSYNTNVTMEMFSAPDVLLATSWEGKPLTREHGAPVRIVMPQFYLWKSAKWIKRITFMAQDRPGFWELRGYHNTGDPWTEQRYS